VLKEESAEEPFIAELRPDLQEATDRLLRRLELGERKGLEAEFKALLRANPDDHLTNYAMGVCRAVVEQDPVGAIPFFEKAIRVFPPLVEAHFNLGNSYLKACRIAEAVGAYRRRFDIPTARTALMKRRVKNSGRWNESYNAPRPSRILMRT